MLPAPNLDDRRFQQLVDDAKRLVQQRCPQWSDHNVSDPGVTLIELFAWMTDQLLYRLNRVPDRVYVKFLELIGIRLFPPTAARADVTFWLSAPQPELVRVAAGTEVATPRNETDEAVSFRTTDGLDIVPCSLTALCSQVEPKEVREHFTSLEAGRPFLCFDTPPKAGDSLLVGLSNPVPSCAVALRFECEIEGVGVDPRNPPLAWDAWDGREWVACEVDRDETGGLNRAGDVVVHVTPRHSASVIGGRRAGWLRCRVTEADAGQPFYSSSPQINRLVAFTVGGTTGTVNGELVEDEVVGISEGVPGQRFPLRHRPVVPGDEPEILEVAGGDGWEEWRPVEGFGGSGPGDRHYVLDPVGGEVVFGPAVREPDGSLRHHGAVPPKGAPLRMRAYRTGGGSRGNVAQGTIRVLKSSIPFVSRIENRRPAGGGVDGEELEEAKSRGPVLLRTRDRAVTAEDYEHLAREAAPQVARVHCAPAGDGVDPGAVRVLVVPAAPDDENGRLSFEQLVPADETLACISAHIDERRVIGARVVVEPPVYQGVTVVARLRARERTSPERLQVAALRALNGYFHPIRGGPDGTGWPFGRPVQVGEVYAVLQRLAGTELMEDARLFAADPITGQRGDATHRIEVARHSLVFSYGHQVRVEGR